MKTILKSLLFCTFFSCCIFSYNDIRDEFGRTTLMRFVIDSQLNLDIIKDDINRLWHICYEYTNITDIYISLAFDPQNHCFKPICNRKIKRKELSLDSDVLAYRKREQDYYQLIEHTIKEVRRLIEQEHVAVAAFDNQGHTVLNYCYLPEIYAELRRCGVPFQWKVWAYFNPWYATCTCATLAISVKYGYFYAQKC